MERLAFIRLSPGRSLIASLADNSSHIWTARLPGGLAPRTYRVAVEAAGEYGQRLSGRLALEVTG